MKKAFAKMSIAALALLAAGCSTGKDGGYMDGMYGYYAANEPMGGLIGPIGEGKGDRFSEYADNPFVSTALQNTSTFSVDADGASYAIVRRYVSEGRTVQPASVRIEELLNYFTFDYAQPTDEHSVAVNAELGTCPWNREHLLLRLGLKGKELTPDEEPLANYVFLVDVSGSMNSSDKLELLKSGLTELLHHLRPQDRISLITYSGEVKKLLESTPVSETATIEAAISKLRASGSTYGEKALQMAYEEALTNYDPAKNNRVILGTDGDFNVGVTTTDALEEMVENYARQGIYMTCLGFGHGNLNDAMMERVSNVGNGTYYYIDSEDEMMKVFVHERQRFVSVANDVKCQLTFDSTRVSQYRLIGYENRILDKEDFEDDTKDAAEIGAGQTITALYELVPATDEALAGAGNTFATFDVRYKKTLGDKSLALSLPLETGIQQETSANFSLAAGVAAYGMLLRKSPYKGEATIGMAKALVEASLSFDPQGRRAQLLKLLGQLKLDE